MSYLSRVIDNDLRYGLNDPEYVYVNLMANNYNNDDSGVPVDLVFNANLTQPLLNDCSQYNIIVERFKVDTFSSIPSIIPKVLQYPNTDVNKTVYSVTLNYVKNGSSVHAVQQYLQFVPQDKTQTVPTSVSSQLANPYYFVYGNEYFVNLINNTFAACFTALNTAVTAESDTLPSDLPPFLDYDPTSSSLILNADSAGYNVQDTTRIEIYFNTAMYSLLCSFNCSKYNLSNGMKYRVNIEPSVDKINVSTVTINGTDYTLLTEYQEFPSVSQWCECSKIAFVSSNLPINPTVMTPPTVYNGDAIFPSTQSQVSYNIITDIEPQFDTSKELYPSVQYIPVTLRKVSMIGRQKLNDFNIKVVWFDRYGNVYNLKLNPDNVATLFLCFMRKDILL